MIILELQQPHPKIKLLSSISNLLNSQVVPSPISSSHFSLLVLNVGNGWEWGLLEGLLLSFPQSSHSFIPFFPTFPPIFRVLFTSLEAIHTADLHQCHAHGPFGRPFARRRAAQAPAEEPRLRRVGRDDADLRGTDVVPGQGTLQQGLWWEDVENWLIENIEHVY